LLVLSMPCYKELELLPGMLFSLHFFHFL
jgi:hypothetical protein